MWILKKKYDYWWKVYGLEKTDRETKTSLFDRNWATSLKPRRRSHPLRLVWWALGVRPELWSDWESFLTTAWPKCQYTRNRHTKTCEEAYPVQHFHILCQSYFYCHHGQFLLVIGQLRKTSLKPFGIINWNLVGSTYGRLCILAYPYDFGVKLTIFWSI